MPRQLIQGLAMGPWREREHLRKARVSGRNQLAHGDNHGIRSPEESLSARLGGRHPRCEFGIQDASALMTFFEDRPGAEKVEQLPAKAAEAEWPLAMSVVNWGGVYYSVWRARGEKAAKAKLHEIAQLPIEIVGVDMELGKLTASLKTEHSLPYADCSAAALAQARKGTLVTSDKDFECVGTALRILWV